MVAICSWSQDWALIRRYLIVMLRYPFRSAIRAILYPAAIIGLGWYLMSKMSGYEYDFSEIATLIPLIAIVTTLCNFYSFTNMMVNDKATGMKSLMISMGLSRFHYYRANSICFIILILPIALCIAIPTKTYLFAEHVDLLPVIALFILFALHLDSFLAACVSFFTSTSYTFIVTLFIIIWGNILSQMLYKYIPKDPEVLKSFILFALSFMPYEPIRIFVYQFMATRPSKHEEFNLASQPYYLTLLSQVFWILFLRLFAIWFEEVCPWQTTSGIRHPCFCFGSAKKADQGDVEEYTDTPGVAAKYFEPSHKENSEIGIKINHVTKTYSNVPAVNEVTFSIYKGETTLLLGHNGAGKSTLMNMILGLVEPDNGRVKIVARSRIQTSIGVCPQTSILDDDLTVKQHLELFSDIKSSLNGYERTAHVIQTINDVSLTGQEYKRPTELSGGMKRKLSLAIAFVGKSEVLILDEPSSGLDPDSRVFVWNAIRRYRSDRTVLLSTQHMEEADYLGDRIAIMSTGRIVCCGSSVFLNNLFGTGYKLRIECKLSNRKRIIDHIKGAYFDSAHPTESDMDTPQDSSKDPYIDLVLELGKSNIKDKDSELSLISLLEDFENNSEKLGIRSYGLKSSSIEDVMLNTGKYFAQEAKDNEQLAMATLSGHLATITDKKVIQQPSCVSLLYALIVKHFQVIYANLFFALLLRVAMPVFGCYAVIYHMNSISKRNDAGDYFQAPHLFIMISSVIYFPVRERATKFKIVQLVSRANLSIYWISQTIVDLLGMIVCVIFVNLFASMFVERTLVTSWHFHGILTLATVLYYMSAMVFCYCLSTIFSDHKSSIGYLFIILMLSSGAWVILKIFVVTVYDEANSNWLLRASGYIFILLLPTDAYVFFILGLKSNCYIPARYYDYDKCDPTSGLSPVIFGLVALSVQIVVYLILLVMIEIQALNIDWYCNWRNICLCCSPRSRYHNRDNREIDRDVVEETTKAVSAIGSPGTEHALVAARLNKSYLRNTKIIDELSFTVNRGECFGLLGVNGAGKTTTFSMITSEICPDSGKILSYGRYRDDNLHSYRELFGFDPQATPELSLTPYQALYLMARLRGVNERSIPMMIKSILELLEMSVHTHKPDVQLSGGTKRKLALGMSLIGSPYVMALDEPTAGVDPLARRGVWRLLKSLRTRNDASIIISSHAMEECEAICDRISIMARGRLRCIGTFLHLRSKFAKGCTLRVYFSGALKEATKQATKSSEPPVPTENGKLQKNMRTPQSTNTQATHLRRSSSATSLHATDHLVNELQQLLGSAIGPSVFKMADRNVNSVTYEILDNRVRRSILFRLMRDFKLKHNFVHYMINDASLEEIFISLAREQQELEQQGY